MHTSGIDWGSGHRRVYLREVLGGGAHQCLARRIAFPMQSLLIALTLVCGGAAVAAPSVKNPAAANALYVDCSQAPATHASAPLGAQANPIASLDVLNGIKLQPGTRILFKRGASCFGSFQPRAGSSGTRDAPITVDAYGDDRLGRPVIAAGCRDRIQDPNLERTKAATTPSGISPYHSLCKADDSTVRAAAIHLYNVEHWEIRNLELTNDALSEGARVGLLIQLEDFGTGHHYRIDSVFVHHVRGYLADVPGNTSPYKETGGILFHVTRHREVPGKKQRKTNFDDVVVENSEIYHVDGIGLATRSAWGCRTRGAPCGDYPPYKGNAAYMKDPATQAATDFFPSTRIVFRNNEIHDIGGDGLVLRTSIAGRVESNLLHHIWMRAPKWSVGAWAINSDDALFQFNEVHNVRFREELEPSDGMAFDADMGTRNMRVVANYSHDNAGGLMLFCACGTDGLGNPAEVMRPIVEQNLSVNDGGRRIFLLQGAEHAVVRDNLIITGRPDRTTPLIENVLYPTPSGVVMERNVFVNAFDAGILLRTKNMEGSYAGLVWSGNQFIGYGAVQDFATPKYVRGEVKDSFQPIADVPVSSLIEQWFTRTGFRQHSFRAPRRP